MEGTSSLEWTVDDVSKKIREAYNEDVAKKFEEQKIDGKVLKLLAREGSPAQFEACGLLTVSDQLLLKEVASEVPTVSINRRNKKPTKLEIKNMTPLNQRIYKAKRRAVSNAAREKWPGNDIPLFKKDEAATKQLDTLVLSLVETCTFEPAGFDKESIKQHILDVCNERRRHRRNGHDYMQPDKRTLKKIKLSPDPEANSEFIDAQSTNDGDVVSNSSDEAGTSSHGSSATNSTFDEDELSGTEEELTLQSAKIIITVMFSAIKFSDVTKPQMMSAAKKFKLTCSMSSKDEMAVELAKAFLSQKFVRLDTKNLAKIGRDNVQKLKVF